MWARFKPRICKMALWITGQIGSLQLFVSLCTIICIVESLEIHVGIRKHGVPLERSFCSRKTRRLVECVYSCNQHTGCRSLGYNKTSAICHLYPSHEGNTENSSGPLLFGNLRDVFRDREKKTQTTEISTQRKRRIVLKRVEMTWRQAEHKYRLMRIHNEIDQTAAVKIVNGSGLKFVAIGAFQSHLKWKTKGGYSKLVYSDWAKGEPGFFDFYAGLSKRSGYKWEGFSYSQQYDGALCEEF